MPKGHDDSTLTSRSTWSIPIPFPEVFSCGSAFPSEAIGFNADCCFGLALHGQALRCSTVSAAGRPLQWPVMVCASNAAAPLGRW